MLACKRWLPRWARVGVAVLIAGAVGIVCWPACAQEAERSGQEPEAIFSGPQVGEAAPPLALEPLLEQTAGVQADSIQLLARPLDQPHVMVFVHETTRPGMALIRVVDAYCGELGDKVRGTVVFLTADVTGTRQWAGVAKNALPKNMQQTLFAGGIEGPGAWGLNRNMSLTAVVVDAKEGLVSANFPIVQPSAAEDGPKIVEAIAKAVGVDPPDPETISKWMGRGAMERNNSGVDLRSFLAPVIRRNATPEQVEAAAQKVEAEAEKSPEFKRAVGDACRRIVAADKLRDYGTEPAQVYLKKWAETFVKELP